jgi:hypothetical protein
MGDMTKSNAEKIIHRKLDELRQMPLAELRHIAEDPLISSETIDGTRYYVEIHARVSGQDIQLMVECARDLPLVRWFGRAAYYTISPNGQLTEGGQPW